MGERTFWDTLRRMAGCEEAGVSDDWDGPRGPRDDWPDIDPGEKVLLIRRFVYNKSGRLLERRTMRMPTDGSSYSVTDCLALAGCRRVEVWMEPEGTKYSEPIRVRWERVNW